MALGFATTEGFIFDEQARPLNYQIRDFKIPRFGEEIGLLQLDAPGIKCPGPPTPDHHCPVIGIRLEVRGEDLPIRLHLEEAVIDIDYARTHIGDSDALLPKRSELTMTHFSGEASRNVIEFSQCHEYGSESTISFEAPSPSLPEAPKPRVREVELPAGLLLPVELDTQIDSKTAAVGDALHARVVQEVRYNGDLVVPRGAALTGHIRSLDRRSAPASFAVGIEFTEVEWEGAHARFYAKLVDLDRKPAGMHRLQTYFDGRTEKVLIQSEIPGVGIFFVDGAGFRTPPGFRMGWRTLAPPGGAPNQRH